jgi:hypothetical protein
MLTSKALGLHDENVPCAARNGASLRRRAARPARVRPQFMAWLLARFQEQQGCCCREPPLAARPVAPAASIGLSAYACTADPPGQGG